MHSLVLGDNVTAACTLLWCRKWRHPNALCVYCATVVSFLCPATKKVAGYYVIPSEILSVRPSVSAPTIRLPATPPTVSGQSFSNFTGAFTMVWRYAYCFFQNLEITFYYIFCIFNLDFFRALILQKCIGSMYLLPATPPTVLGQSFSNFTGAFRMVWRYAYCFFFQNLEIIFYYIFFAFLT